MQTYSKQLVTLSFIQFVKTASNYPFKECCISAHISSYHTNESAVLGRHKLTHLDKNEYLKHVEIWNSMYKKYRIRILLEIIEYN